MPMPPALAKDLEYSSVKNERQTPVAPSPPNGPSPLTPVNICWNIELRNTASKPCEAALALAFPAAAILAAVGTLSLSISSGLMPGAEIERAPAITSPRYRLGWRQRP